MLLRWTQHLRRTSSEKGVTLIVKFYESAIAHVTFPYEAKGIIKEIRITRK
jgi:hypothetical protein